MTCLKGGRSNLLVARVLRQLADCAFCFVPGGVAESSRAAPTLCARTDLLWHAPLLLATWGFAATAQNPADAAAPAALHAPTAGDSSNVWHICTA